MYIIQTVHWPLTHAGRAGARCGLYASRPAPLRMRVPSPSQRPHRPPRREVRAEGDISTLRRRTDWRGRTVGCPTSLSHCQATLHRPRPRKWAWVLSVAPRPTALSIPPLRSSLGSSLLYANVNGRALLFSLGLDGGVHPLAASAAHGQSKNLHGRRLLSAVVRCSLPESTSG
ncbi:hypothetical protein BD413DRAFT_573433 [Trametes elegans]|nr:hypothetical protein BD413DRAFT_573433 [Trametes elegans]